MTNSQKQQIATMRGNGGGYGTIAVALGLSENTIKSYCRRNNLSSDSVFSQSNTAVCPTCGKPLVQTAGAKQKKFCSDKCRMAWWNAHPESVNRKNVNQYICAVCGVEFKSHDNRKYCSRACFGMSRRRNINSEVAHG